MVTKYTKAVEIKNLLKIGAVGTLMLPSLGWSAADGRGHNGPNLAPTSIPVELEHGIKAERLSDAFAVCYATGDSNTGVVSLLQRLVDQLTGGKASDPQYKYSYYGRGYDDSGAFYGSGSISAPYGYASLSLVRTETFLTGSNGQFSFQPKLDRPRSFDYDDVVLEAAELPTVKYRSVVKDTGYDEYGREAKDDRILMGVSISFSPAAYGTSVRLFNSKTHVKSAITINTVEYVECLKSELQKRAE